MLKKVSNGANFAIRVSLTCATLFYLLGSGNAQAAMVTALLLIANEVADIADALRR